MNDAKFDYDCDGATSSSALMFSDLKCNICDVLIDDLYFPAFISKKIIFGKQIDSRAEIIGSVIPRLEALFMIILKNT